jgi:hypothetical protein
MPKSGVGEVIDFDKAKRTAKILRYYKAQDGHCYLCGGKMTLAQGFNNTAEVEHLVPKGHRRVAGKYNEAAAGMACNRFKADKPLHEVSRQLQLLKLCEQEDRKILTKLSKGKHNMKKLGAALALVASTTATDAQDYTACQPTEQLFEILENRYGETRQSCGTFSPIHLDCHWANAETGTYTNTRTNIQEGISCIDSSGSNWQPIAQPDKLEPNL